MKIAVIGAGHAGVAAAQTLAKENIDVTLFSNEKHLPYYRPRIPSVAFAQAEVEDSLMHPEEWFEENKIKLLLDTEVTFIDELCEVQTSEGKKYKFDKIIFSYGAAPVMPPFSKGVSSEKLIPLWNMENAISIKNQIGKIKDIVIIGGGVIGLEAAIRAVDAGFQVKVIERADTLLPRNLNASMSKALSKYLKEKNVEVLTDLSVQEIEEKDSKVIIKSDKLSPIEAELIIMSIGAGIHCNLPQQVGIKCNKKICVDQFLQTNNENFFASGDIAEVLDYPCPCSAIRASKQGKTAAMNAISDKPENKFEESPVSLQVKYSDFSLFAIGNPSEQHNEVIIEQDLKQNILRLINVDSSKKITSVQMLGSNTDYKKYEKIFIEGGVYDKL